MGATTRVQRVEVVANVASGSVAADAPAEIERILIDHGLDVNVCAPATCDLTACLQAAVDKAPDLLIILAGDGTARAAAQMCGPDGPVIAPLPGGTMNMLPHAVYGVLPWPEALDQALKTGVVETIGGGAVDGHRFLVSAILGSPALWAPAREAVRQGRVRLALTRARRAARQAFTGRLRFTLDGGPREKAEALVFMGPLTSKALDDTERALEAAAFNVEGAAAAVRLGFNYLMRDWRDDPAVEARRCRLAEVWSSRGIPAIVDGEPVRLKSTAKVTFEPALVRVLALPREKVEI